MRSGLPMRLSSGTITQRDSLLADVRLTAADGGELIGDADYAKRFALRGVGTRPMIVSCKLILRR